MNTIEVCTEVERQFEDGEWGCVEVVLTVRIDRYFVVKGNSRADNPDDFYGYDEIDYTIMSCKEDAHEGKEIPYTENDHDDEKIKEAIRDQESDDGDY